MVNSKGFALLTFLMVSLIIASMTFQAFEDLKTIKKIEFAHRNQQKEHLNWRQTATRIAQGKWFSSDCFLHAFSEINLKVTCYDHGQKKITQYWVKEGNELRKYAEWFEH